MSAVGRRRSSASDTENDVSDHAGATDLVPRWKQLLNEKVQTSSRMGHENGRVEGSVPSNPIQRKEAKDTTVTVRHATDGGKIQLCLCKSMTMLEVKKAIVSKLGWGNVTQIRILIGGSANASFRDDELLGEKRRLTVAGLGFTADTEATIRDCDSSRDLRSKEKQNIASRETHQFSPGFDEQAKSADPELVGSGPLPAESPLKPSSPADVGSSKDELTTNGDELHVSSENQQLMSTEANLCVLLGSGCAPQENEEREDYLELLAWAAQKYLPLYAKGNDQCLNRSATQQDCDSDSLTTPLWQAVKGQSTEDVRRLLSKRANANILDDQGATPLLIAVQHHNASMCSLLLAFSADADLKPSTNHAACVASAQLCPQSRVAKILERGPQAARHTVIRDAILTASMDVIQALSVTVHEVSASDSAGQTPLHLCVSGLEHRYPNTDPDLYLLVMGNLLDARAGIDSRDAFGETPLMLAVREAAAMSNWSADVAGSRQGRVLLQMCRLLISRQANVHLTNTRSGETPLTCAAAADSVQVVKVLLDCRADAFHQSSSGLTAFHAAGHNDRIVNMLLDWSQNSDWSEFDCQLYRSMRGKFNPDKEIQQPPAAPVCKDAGSAPCKVSVICPTTPSRSHFHKQLYDCFQSQTYKEKELVIIETGAKPSKFFTSPPISGDPQVIYRFYKDSEGINKVSIGTKRNLAIRLASGALIAQFDDDDLYSPVYLDRMVDILLRHGAHVLKLSSWFIFNLYEGAFGYCDPQCQQGIEEAHWVDSQLFGYGFSYVFQRNVAISHSFPDLFMSEDYVFLTNIQNCGYSVCVWPDLDGICLRLQHGKNTSLSWAHDLLPHKLMPHMQVARNPRLQHLLNRYAKTVTVPGATGPYSSDLAALAVAVLKFSAESKAAGDSISDACPVDIQIFECGDFSGSASLKQAFQHLQRRKTKLTLTNYAQQRQKFDFQVATTSTLREIRERVANRLGDAHNCQVSLGDVEQVLEDDQLLLSRTNLFYTLTVQTRASKFESLD